MPPRIQSRNHFSCWCLLLLGTPALIVATASNGLADIAGPRGIYILGSGRDNANTPVDERVTGIRDYDFVDGYTLRIHWEDVDLGSGQYDFEVIGEALALLENNQHATKMNLELLVLTPPSHIITNAAQTWQHFKAGTLPVPWDVTTQQGYADLVTALANHSVFDAAAGAMVPLAQHPVFGSLNASVPGISSIRDNGGNSGLTKLVDLPSYDRQKFVDAVVQAVGVNRNAFADQFGFLGYFSMTDSENANFGGDTLNETLLGALLTDFNNPGQPHVGLFQELLSDVGPNPSHALGQNLLAAKDDTYIMFQALASWLNPHTGADKLTSKNPSNGIELGFNNYGATFFELYLGDIDGAQNEAVDAAGNPLIDGLTDWHDFIEALASDFDQDGDIDGEDLAEWQAGFQTAGLTAGDFLNWQRNLGHQQPGATPFNIIPEPSTALLASLAFGLYRFRSRRFVIGVGLLALQRTQQLGDVSRAADRDDHRKDSKQPNAADEDDFPKQHPRIKRHHGPPKYW